jgi:hypothetical protein
LFSAYVDGNNFFLIQFRENGDNGRFEVFNYSSTFDWRVETNALLRDPSAWYHIVVALDTTQATDSNRIKIYVNGTLQTLATTTYPSLNFDSDANNNIAHYIGQDGGNGRYHNGYLTEINFIDGQQLAPSDFGETDSATGVWKPKKYTGTYGTNGFYLSFADNTSTTTLGYDDAGSNDWTTNNFSVTAGAGNDSLVDSPTAYGTDTGVGGEVRGNYCTFNPLFKLGGTAAGTWCLNGALQAKSDSNASMVIFGTMGLGPSTKFYNEFTMTNVVETNDHVGIVTDIQAAADSGTCIAYKANGDKIVNGTTSAYGATYTDGDIIGIAVNLVDNEVTFYKNGASQGTITGVTAGTYFHRVRFNNVSGQQSECFGNWGQRAFSYTAPSGFKALCTTNLPTPTIGATSTTQANDYFNTVLYTGTGSSLGVTGVGFQPDWVWIKERSGAADHGLYDAVRGVQNQLESNTTTAETTEATGLTAFGADGFTVGALAQLNTSADTYVAWNWNAGGSNATNTSGTINSTVRANTTSGFSIVTYTGTGANATVGHGLGVAPSWVICKRRSGTGGWPVFVKALNNNAQYMTLNNTDATNTDAGVWNSTAPTSTTFSLGTDTFANGSGATYVAYCFAPVAGYSAFGSWTGNGNADGPFIYLGFRPRYLLIKKSSDVDTWAIQDSSRNTYNVVNLYLSAESSAAEQAGSGGAYFDFLSNGFKIRTTSNQVNTNGGTYIYACFAESPFKYSLAR